MLNHSFFEVNFVGVTKKNSTFAIPNKKWKKSDSVVYADPTFFLDRLWHLTLSLAVQAELHKDLPRTASNRRDLGDTKFCISEIDILLNFRNHDAFDGGTNFLRNGSSIVASVLFLGSGELLTHQGFPFFVGIDFILVLPVDEPVFCRQRWNVTDPQQKRIDGSIY